MEHGWVTLKGQKCVASLLNIWTLLMLIPDAPLDFENFGRKTHHLRKLYPSLRSTINPIHLTSKNAILVYG